MNNTNQNNLKSLRISTNRRQIWIVSLIALIVSILGFIFSWLNPSIKAPLRPGLDFTGGTQINLERKCIDDYCSTINSEKVLTIIESNNIVKNNNSSYEISSDKIKIQFLDGYKSLVLRLPFLSATQSQSIINSLEPFIGPYEKGDISVDTIGPSLGAQLLRTSLISLIAAFAGIALYINFRFDRKYAFLALLALAHDVIIVCGVFAWLGILYQIEIDSLFAVSLLTIAGYSVNDTVVVFDRIREISKKKDYSISQKIDNAVQATLTRTLYTSGSTLLPLIALIFFGGQSLYWFSISLTIGVIVGSWSSIALAPSLLTLLEKQDS